MGALLALAPNPIDTRAFATRALATAPESAGIGDMQGKATPGLGALGRGIAAAGQNAAAAKEKAEEDAAYEGLKARQEQDRIDAEKQAKDEMEEALRAANHYWGDPGTLEEHFNAHGMDVGASSMEEYADMAHELYLNKGLCQASVDEEGITRVYDAARNLFRLMQPRRDDKDLPRAHRRPGLLRQAVIGHAVTHAREET